MRKHGGAIEGRGLGMDESNVTRVQVWYMLDDTNVSVKWRCCICGQKVLEF